MTDLVIEKGIAMPPHGKRGSGMFGNIIYEMDIGDSVLVTKPGHASNMIYLARKNGRKMSSRRVEGGWRVWRIK